MDIINKEDFKKAGELETVEDKERSVDYKKMTDDDFAVLVKAMSSPIESQKELAAQLKYYLEGRMARELRDKGVLSDHTRRWTTTYNTVLDNIQKSLYGNKSVSMNFHKVISHSDVSLRIRDANKRNK